MCVFSVPVAAGFEPTSMSLGGGCLNLYPILTPHICNYCNCTEKSMKVTYMNCVYVSSVAACQHIIPNILNRTYRNLFFSLVSTEPSCKTQAFRSILQGPPLKSYFQIPCIFPVWKFSLSQFKLTLKSPKILRQIVQ